MPIEPVNEQTIIRAAKIIADGGLVAFPTETVYGLGANARDPLAVARVFEVKNRPSFDPLIVHIAEVDDLKAVVTAIDDKSLALMRAFWPGPLSIVMKKNAAIPDIVTSGLDTVAVRMPGHPVALDLIRAAGVPIAAPSANPFGYLSPTNARHVAEALGDGVDLVLDGGTCRVGVESTIVRVDGDRIRVLRLGGISIEDIELHIGPVELSSPPANPEAPGQLEFHYSPHTPIRIVDEVSGEPDFDETKSDTRRVQGSRIGVLSFNDRGLLPGHLNREVLSPTGNLREAAANLFDCLHRLDDRGLDIIYAQAVPETGLGRAIMDRLRRAAARR